MGDGEKGESFAGMYTTKMRETAREVIVEECNKCVRMTEVMGIATRNKEDIDVLRSDIEKGFDKIGSDIKTLFDNRYQDAKDSSNEHKEKHKWTLEQALLILMCIATIVIPLILK